MGPAARHRDFSRGLFQKRSVAGVSVSLEHSGEISQEVARSGPAAVGAEVDHDLGMLLVPDVGPEEGSADLSRFGVLYVDRRIVEMNYARAKQLLFHLPIKGCQQLSGLGQPVAGRGARDFPAAPLTDPFEAVQREVSGAGELHPRALPE